MAEGEEIYADVEFPIGPTRVTRPYVVLNMISSVDGRSSRSGKASGLGGPADRRVMRSLRSRVDAVMVGAGTLRAEPLNLGLDDRDAGQPLAIVVTGGGDVPVDNLILQQKQELILATPEGAGPAGWHADWSDALTLRVEGPEPGRVDVAGLLRVLKASHAVERLLVEGGPALNRSLLEEDLVDEIFLTIAPKILTGPQAAIVADGVASGTAANPREATLVSAHAAQGELFLRYRLNRPR